MTTDHIVLLLFLIGLILGAVDVVRSKGQSFVAWGLVAVSAGLLLLHIV